VSNILLSVDGDESWSGWVVLLTNVELIDYSYFCRVDRIRGTICFFLGIVLVTLRWGLIGLCLEGFGFLNLFGNFLPTVVIVGRQVPVLSTFLNLPVVCQAIDYLAGCSVSPEAKAKYDV
jgi:hypothetical protein